MTKVSIMPELSELEQLGLTRFLENVLGNEKLDTTIRRAEYGLSQDRLMLYVDGRPQNLYLGSYWSWEVDSTCIYIGGRGEHITYGQRLPIVLGLMQYVNQTETLKELAAKAITRHLLSEMNQLRGALVVSEPAATGIAFSESQCAALVDGVWMLPSGEPVDVSGSEWTVCSGVVPERVVEAPVAINTETPVTDLNALRVGQRVRWTHRNDAPDGVEGTVGEMRDTYREVIYDSGERTVLARADELTLLPDAPTTIPEAPAIDANFNAGAGPAFPPTTTTEFRVGQRVRYSSVYLRSDLPAGEGVISEIDAGRVSRAPYYVEDSLTHVKWWIELSALSAIEEVSADAPEPRFQVGDRVRYSTIVDTAHPAGVGTIDSELSTTHYEGSYKVICDGLNDWYWIKTDALEHLFEVGQRVRYSEVPGAHLAVVGEGEIIRQAATGSWWIVRGPDGSDWSLPPNGLTPIRSN